MKKSNRRSFHHKRKVSRLSLNGLHSIESLYQSSLSNNSNYNEKNKVYNEEEEENEVKYIVGGSSLIGK